MRAAGHAHLQLLTVSGLLLRCLLDEVGDEDLQRGAGCGEEHQVRDQTQDRRRAPGAERHSRPCRPSMGALGTAPGIGACLQGPASPRWAGGVEDGCTSQLSALRARKQPTGGWSRKTLWRLSQVEGPPGGGRSRDAGRGWLSASPGEGLASSQKHADAPAGVQPAARVPLEPARLCSRPTAPSLTGSTRQDPRGAHPLCGVYTDGAQAQAAQSTVCVAVGGCMEGQGRRRGPTRPSGRRSSTFASPILPLGEPFPVSAEVAHPASGRGGHVPPAGALPALFLASFLLLAVPEP